MPTDVIMPQMGESIFEGTITKWLKKPGDRVQRDEPLFEISTDKVDAEIPAPASGVLQDIKAAEGATVQVNAVVGTIAADGEAVAAPAKPAPLRPLQRPSRNQWRCQLLRRQPLLPRRKKRTITLAPLLSYAKLPANTTSTFRRLPALASAAASPSKTLWRLSRVARPPRPRLQPLQLRSRLLRQPPQQSPAIWFP